MTLRSTTIVTICSYNFFLELPTRSCWCYASNTPRCGLEKVTLLLLRRPGRSSCYALLFFLEHSSMLWMLRSDLQHALDARLLGIFPNPFLPSGSSFSIYIPLSIFSHTTVCLRPCSSCLARQQAMRRQAVSSQCVVRG